MLSTVSYEPREREPQQIQSRVYLVSGPCQAQVPNERTNERTNQRLLAKLKNRTLIMYKSASHAMGIAAIGTFPKTKKGGFQDKSGVRQGGRGVGGNRERERESACCLLAQPLYAPVAPPTNELTLHASYQ